MGFFDKLRGKTAGETPAPATEAKTVYAPFSGNVIPLEEMPDPVFSAGVLGPGCGIEPLEETVYAPFNGTVTQVADSKHAIGLESEDGIELLIHVGVDTVDMNGKGFHAFVKVGQKVHMGDKLLAFSASEIKAAGHPTTTAVLVTNADDAGTPELLSQGRMEQSAPVMKIKT